MCPITSVEHLESKVVAEEVSGKSLWVWLMLMALRGSFISVEAL